MFVEKKSKFLIDFLGNVACINAGLIHLALGFVGCCWLYAFPSRSRLREHFALPEKPCSDYWVHICCTPCAICQESRELKNQGADPSLGTLINLDGSKIKRILAFLQIKNSQNIFSCFSFVYFRLGFEYREMETRENNSSHCCTRHEPLSVALSLTFRNCYVRSR